MTKHVFISALGRKGGSVIYGKEILTRLKEPKEVLVSEYSEVVYPDEFEKTKTYKNILSFIWRTLFVLPALKRRWAKLIERNGSAIYYTPYFHYWNLSLIRLFRKLGGKVVITVHDGIPHTGDGKFLESYLNRQCIKNADEIIFLSNYVKEVVRSEIGFEAEAHVVPHGLIRWNELKSDIRTPNGKLKFLFLGRQGKYKGLDLLIKAFNTIDSQDFDHLTIAGQPGTEENAATDSEKIRRINKWVSDDQLIDLMNSHDVLILPYREATQSGVITIGISASMPMIVTRVGGLPEQLNQDEAVWVEPDVDSIKEGIETLINDRATYTSISTKLKNKAEELSWDTIANTIDNIIRS